MCPDSKVRLNDKPPFKFKCDGMYLTPEGAEAFEAELARQIRQSDEGAFSA